MDVVNNVRTCIATWTSGGQTECQRILVQPHCDPNEPSCASVLTTAYQALLFSTLKSWPAPHRLTSETFVQFIQGVFEALPSSSSQPVTDSTNVAVFGEYLVDMFWAADSELDEIMGDAKIAAAGSQGADVAASIAAKAKNAESDKLTLADIAKRLLKLNILSHSVCRERWESGLLASVGLFPDKTLLDKKEIRAKTGLFYKQNKFNLLREQSEGYSKLTAELTSGLPPAHSTATGRPTESFATIHERARSVWDKVTSLIGYFDLDPNRALDVILDVMSVHLATHHSFFLAILSLSPWSGSYQPSGLLSDTSMDTDPTPVDYRGKTLDEVLSLAAPVMRNPPGTASNDPRVLAQVLGFKFTYYFMNGANEPAPKNLYLTAAILVREGLIALEDLYSHLSPSDEDMDEYRKGYFVEVTSRIAGAKNSQLAMAAPLESASSSSKPKVATPSEQKKPEKVRPSQKASLVIALLAVGALKPAIWILSKFPWLPDAHPEIADLMIRAMNVSVTTLYDQLVPTKGRNTNFSQPRARWGSTGVTQPPPRKTNLTLTAPTPPFTHLVEFVFFYPDWTAQIPICASLDDLADVIEPLMRFITVHISRDPLFIAKFLRLGRLQVLGTFPTEPVSKGPTGVPDPNHPIRMFWFKVLRMYILPALPLIRGNAVCTVEVWNIIRLYDTTIRWKLYGEWKGTTYKSHPELRIREVQTDRESKGILRRLSSNTTDSLSGAVAKLAHSNPCIFFKNAVTQIMAYDNLAEVVAQALRYVTNMGFDVLTYIILEALANPNKERLKDDGVNTADWLQSLAAFTGMLFRRYSTDITPVLKYVVHQLHGGQTTEIIVLRELIWKMAGIEPLPSLSDSQVTAMAGGPALRIEAVASTTRGARLDPGDVTYKAPYRLGRALLDSSLALPLLIQVAQQRQSSVFTAPDAHLKSLASLYDTTHGVLLQYLELLNSPSIISPADYAKNIVPPLGELGQKYGICAPICMQIIRPILHSALLASALNIAEKDRLASEEREKGLKQQLVKRDPLATSSRVSSPHPTEHTKSSVPDSGSEDVVMDGENGVSMTVAEPGLESPWLSELQALFDDVKLILPVKAYELIGPGFYTTFWQLSTYDLTPPSVKYDEEGSALRTLSRQEDSKYIAAERSADRTKRQTASLHRQRRDRYNSFVHTLAQEFKEQTLSRQFTLKRLNREKQHWFSHAGSKTQALAAALIEHCIQPRCLLSPMDADFCAQMIKVMHTQGTVGFHTLRCYDGLLGDHMKIVLFSCSEYEARNYGRFLLGILSDLYKWFQDESLYISDNRAKGPAGKFIILPGLQPKYSSAPEEIPKWTSFQSILKKWHRKILKSFTDCLQTGEFMHVYNTIIVLKEILPVFPLATVADHFGPTLDRAMDQVVATEERGDLKILARAYSAGLKKRESFWSSSKGGNKTKSSHPEKPKGAAPPTGPSSRSATIAPPPPSGPRSQLPTSTSNSLPKSAVESLRPTVVKRVRPDSNNPASPKSTPNPAELPKSSEPGSNSSTMTGKDAPRSPRSNLPTDEKTRTEDMPPPVVPSQTPSAQELRETAKQSINRTADKIEEKAGNSSLTAPSSPRRRSPSPNSRPGTRSHSSDSRRSHPEREPEEKRADLPTPTRRDSLTHNRSERSGRDRNSRDDDRDKDRGRDRHGDRERDRDHRDRDRARERDRHRRDDRDKKDRGPIPANPSPSIDDRQPPARPDSRRAGPPADDSSSGIKRRRGTDDDPSDRPSKRNSRKDGPRDDERRGPPGKESHDRGRGSERGRRDRGSADNSDNNQADKAGEKRPSTLDSPTKSSALPSAPRAMSSSDVRPGKGDPSSNRDRDRHRDHPVGQNGASGSDSVRLLSRIGEKDSSRAPQPLKPNPYPGPARGGRDGGRKRIAQERESDMGEQSSQLGNDQGHQTKRTRIHRNNYNSGGGPPRGS